MLDASRNGVLTVASVRRIVELIAAMGLDMLMLYTKDTYEFLERMLRAVSAPYRSRRINLGMDEMVQLGLGKYHHDDPESYRRMLRHHKDFPCRGVVFAGGIWTWNGVSVNYRKTFCTTNAALTACKQEGVEEVFATLWGDDGQGTSLFSSLLGMQLYAEHGYADRVDEAKLRKRFAFCAGRQERSRRPAEGLLRPQGP